MFKCQDITIKPIKELYNGNVILAPINNGLGITIKPDEEPLIVIPKDKGYIEILGHRIDGFNNLEEFTEYLFKLREFDKERKEMEAELRKYRAQYVKMKNYLEEQIAASIFLRDHIDGGERLSIQEKVYREIRDEFYKED